MLYFFNFNSSSNLVVPVDVGLPVTVLHVVHVHALVLHVLVLVLVLLVQLNCRLQFLEIKILLVSFLPLLLTQVKIFLKKIEPAAHPHNEQQVNFSTSNFSNALIFQLESSQEEPKGLLNFSKVILFQLHVRQIYILQISKECHQQVDVHVVHEAVQGSDIGWRSYM